jgi:hypothetical protein|tara:strand:+ start:335 stop:496 length:162 start_codon:yes stop_codon:yes gene_type:complete
MNMVVVVVVDGMVVVLEIIGSPIQWVEVVVVQVMSGVVHLDKPWLVGGLNLGI